MERRLAAIFAADMVSFSRLMEAKEVGTITRQKRHRAELIDPKIAAHGGHIIKPTGDGMIAEFSSVVEAVQCAVSVQSEMKAREADVPEDRRIRYRVAVNLGDVIFDDEEHDVYGDGVNIAARLEALAEPGGVVVSGTAYDHLKANVEVGYEDLGEQQVKNISTPVRVYRVVPERQTVPSKAPTPTNRHRPLVLAAVTAVGLIFVGIAVWQFVLQPNPAETGLAEDAPILTMPEGPKIVVLPFDNLSGVAEQDYFVDGLTEDLTTRLAEHGYLFVIGRNTAFKYKGESPDIREVGRDLGVDYVLEGSIRRSDARIRVTAQLVNARDGAHVWAKTYDRDLSAKSVFDIQDELTIGISEAIGGTKGVLTESILNATRARRPKELASFECVLLARNYWNTYDPTVHARARACMENAVKREPDFSDGWQNLSTLYRAEYENGLKGKPDPQGRAEEALGHALRLDPDNPNIHATRAMMMRSLGRIEDARSSVFEAIRLSPNDPATLHFLAISAVYTGLWETGWPIWQKVIKLDPSPPSWTYWTAFNYQYNAGNLDEAYRYALILKHETDDGFHWVAASEASVLAQMGRVDEARAALDRVLAKRPNFAETARKELAVWWGHSPDYMARFMSGLYKAGLPKLDATDG